jgi:sialate O-acetylesterase
VTTPGGSYSLTITGHKTVGRCHQGRASPRWCWACCAAEPPGDPENIHAKDKQPVGDRLALCALAKYYGKNVAYSGPTLESVERLPGSIRLHFTHADGGLVVKGDKLEEFSIAGDDRKWLWADARVEDGTVVVSSRSVSNSTQVRYYWQSNPAATLFNGADLPAVRFRTDTWPGKTEGHRPY